MPYITLYLCVIFPFSAHPAAVLRLAADPVRLAALLDARLAVLPVVALADAATVPAQAAPSHNCDVIIHEHVFFSWRH